jgi:hypothetical protein
MNRFELTIPKTSLATTEVGNPALPRKDAYHKAARAGGYGRAMIVRTTAAEDFIARLGGLLLRNGHRCSKADPLITDGCWRLTLVQFAPRRRKGTELALLDSDACLSPVKDALKETGVYLDDMLVVQDRTVALYRKGDPGLWICLVRLDEAKLEALRELYMGA